MTMSSNLCIIEILQALCKLIQAVCISVYVEEMVGM